MAMNTVRRIAAMLALVAVVMLGGHDAFAQQVNPTANAINEEALLQALQSGDVVGGRISIPDDRAAALIKPGNKGWAALHSGNMRLVSIVSIVGMLALLIVFYLVRGRIRIDGGPSGRTILRFAAFERFGHWLMATSFIILAITGLNLVLGRQIVAPLIGEAAFGALSAWGKLAHNYLAWPFMVSLAFVFLVWVWHNLPSRVDLVWLKHGGGLFSDGDHPPARKFNAGQKLIFWSVIIGGGALSFTGVMMLFPGWAGSGADWQFYQTIHGVASAVLTAIILAHIYIGSVGMEGAFDAMGKGEVDRNWAQQHHSLWVEEVEGSAAPKRHDGRSAMPAE